MRLQLATEGLPQSGRLGFELFDKTNFGATEFAEQVNFRRALEGELERSVLSLDRVERARVHISLPKRSVFLDYDRPAKASVVLQLRPGAELTPQQIDGITHLVSSAVEGLDPGQVVLVDTRGRLLARPHSDSEAISGEQLEYRSRVERQIQSKIEGTLEPYVGFDKVRVNAAADIDWSRGEQTEEVLDPNTVVMTTQKLQETAGPPNQSGAPGTASNVPRQPLAPGIGGTVNSRVTETTNYQTSRTVTRMDLAKGAVQRLSVAVLVDSKSHYDDKGNLVREPRTDPEMLESLRLLAVAAAGIVEQRGDRLTLESLPFTIFEPIPERPAQPGPPGWLEFALEIVPKVPILRDSSVCSPAPAARRDGLADPPHRQKVQGAPPGPGRDRAPAARDRSRRSRGQTPGSRTSPHADRFENGLSAEFPRPGAEKTPRRGRHQRRRRVRSTAARLDP